QNIVVNLGISMIHKCVEIGATFGSISRLSVSLAILYFAQSRLPVTMSPCAKFVDLDSTTSATIPPESTSFNSNGGIYDFTSFILPLIYGSTDKYSVRINTSES